MNIKNIKHVPAIALESSFRAIEAALAIGCVFSIARKAVKQDALLEKIAKTPDIVKVGELGKKHERLKNKLDIAEADYEEFSWKTDARRAAVHPAVQAWFEKREENEREAFGLND